MEDFNPQPAENGNNEEEFDDYSQASPFDDDFSQLTESETDVVPQRPSVLGQDGSRSGPDERPSITGEESTYEEPEVRPSITGKPVKLPGKAKPRPQPTSTNANIRSKVAATQPPVARPAQKQPATDKQQTTPAPRKKRKARPVLRRPRAKGRQATPTWIKRLRKEMPPYADEMFAFILIAIGLVSLLSLIGLAGGQLAENWALFLSRTLGLGAAVVPLAIFAAGALVLVPKLGGKIRINWRRVIAGEIFFVMLLSYIHLISNDPDPWAIAFAGNGGGWIGWSISVLLTDLVGAATSGFVLLIGLAISAAFLVGVGRRELLNSLSWIGDRAEEVAEKLEPPLEPRRPKRSPKPAIPAPQPSMPLENNPVTISELPGSLPAMPGRPSIVTGNTGSGATNTLQTRRPVSITRTRHPGKIKQDDIREAASASLEAAPAMAEQENDAEAAKTPRYDFSLTEKPDKRKIGRRSSVLPPLELLDDTDYERPAVDELNANAEIIKETLEDFDVDVDVVGVEAGPTVTQYAVQPFKEVDAEDGKKTLQRVRVTRITSLDQDLALALAASRVRIQAPVPGHSYIGIEVPNDHPGIVSLRPVMESEQFHDTGSPLTIALGRNVAGRSMVFDLAKMPHLLIAGTTGSGKSVCISSMTTCLVTNNSPYSLRLIMIDPKMVELVRFNGLPHLLGRVEVEMERIIGVLRWVTREMDRRYKLMQKAQARNIDIYNTQLGSRRWRQHLPYIVVFIDELADLMNFMPNETERLLVRLAQMARATGIHLVVATQRPSTDVVTGLIKANFPARLSFSVASNVDSRVILDASGAQQLIGRGDMLFQPPEAMAPIRIQGCFVGDGEMERIVNYWVQRQEDGKTPIEGEAPWERSLTKAAIISETDDLLVKAVELVQREGTASASLLQRKLNVGFPRAARLMDSLHEIGVIGEEQAGGRTRDVLIKPDDDVFKNLHEQRNE